MKHLYSCEYIHTYMQNMSNKQAKKVIKIKPLNKYKLNEKEVFNVSTIRDGKVFGSVTPIECINDPFVIIDRHIWLDVLEVIELKLLKEFKGLWDGRIYK